MKNADIGVGLGLLVISGLVFWTSQAYRQTVIYTYGPNLFPQLLSVITGICSIVLIVQALQGKALSRKDHIDSQGFVRMIISIGMCIGYLLIMQVIGFAIATGVFLFALMTFLRQKGLVRRAISSISVALIVWAIFRFFLVIPVPEGMLSFTF